MIKPLPRSGNHLVDMEEDRQDAENKCSCGGRFTEHHGKKIGEVIIACNRCGQKGDQNER